MTVILYRLGRFSARRPWVVIGLWALTAALVISASSAFGRDMEDSFSAPGVDSQIAVDLLAEAGSDRAGLTARVVTSPSLRNRRTRSRSTYWMPTTSGTATR